jgi:hypothetical protein
MGRFSAYGRLEKDIAAAYARTMRGQWEFGRRLLCDPFATTPAGDLRPGVLAELITEARRRREQLTEAEVLARLEAGRAYPCESQIRRAQAAHETWDALCEAGFPAFEAEAGEEPFDPRTAAEKARAAEKQLALGETDDPEQLELFRWFPDEFDELSSIAALRKHALAMKAMAARFADRADERLEYVDQLSAAVDGDESKTWEEAQAALDARAVTP